MGGPENKPLKRPLRLGLLVDSLTQPRWIADVIQEIRSSDVADIALVIKNETQNAKRGRFKSYWHNRNYLLYALYSRFDNFRVAVKPDPFEPVDISAAIAGCPILNLTPVAKKYSDWFDQKDLSVISQYDLDVALAFGFRILKGEALNIAKHGVWSYHHGDNLVNRGGPAGFWEVIDGSPVTGSILQVLTEDLDNGIIIYRSYSATSDRFSVKANRASLYWKSASFVLRCLTALAQGSALPLPENHLYRPYSNRLYKLPTNRELLRRLPQMVAKYGVSKIQAAVSFNQWVLAYRYKSSASDTNNSFYRFKYLTPPADRFWADPVPEKVAGRYYVFFEEYLYSSQKGHISVVELDKSGIVTSPAIVLERDYHLSYPFIFQWNGNYYMVPETSSNNQIELYRCVSFPLRWEFEAVLMPDVQAKDATLIEVNGKWWMFLSLAAHGVSDELSLYYADTPLGPWTAHPLNPVKSDVRSARSAGRLFYWNGDLYRPAQDCSKRYGYAISINKIISLDPFQFSEVEVARILPNWDKNLLATHTLNSSDDLTVIDCLFRRAR